jgi:methyl-accepting chemotaxis protein PixJ
MVSSESKSTALDRGKKRSPLRSIGAKLFIAVIGGAVVGLGSAAYLFYQNLENQTTIKIQKAVDIEVKAIEIELTAVVQATTDLGGATKFLTEQQIQDDRVYESLVLEFFNKRPQLAMAAYFMQTPRGILKSKEWYSPYFYIDRDIEGQLGTPLPAPNDKVIYSELFNYPIRDYYQIPFKKKGSAWIEPYLWYGATITTFATPIIDKNNNLIGFSAADVNVTEIAKNISPTVIDNNGYFTLISEEGRLISYSPDPKKAVDRVSYDTIPELKAIWSQIGNKKEGLIEANGKYWIFRRLPSTNWLMLAAVPYSVVQMPILRITLTGTIGAGLVLAGAVFWFVSYLNGRLKPILTECENMADLSPELNQQMRENDEIEGLSISFFELIRQINIKQQQLQKESEERLVEVRERLKLSEAMEKEGEVLEREIGKILDVVGDLERGDLTVKAPVGEGITGLVADNLNRFVEEISYALNSVLAVAIQVSDSALELRDMAQEVTESAAQQAQGAISALQLTESVDKSARYSSEQLEEANEKIDRVNRSIEEGRTDIQVMGLAISSLQQGKDQMKQQMSTLGEFVNMAEQFVEEQKQVASLSQTLAMSANLLAARASEQKDPRQFLSLSREFGTIAEQMKSLSQQTNSGLSVLQKRTEKVREAVGTVGEEVESLAGLVENFTYGVDRAQQIFDRVRRTTNELTQAEESILLSNQTIVEDARSSAKAMQEIALISEKTARLTETTDRQSEEMKQLSANLIQSLSLFRLPEQ